MSSKLLTVLLAGALLAAAGSPASARHRNRFFRRHERARIMSNGIGIRANREHARGNLSESHYRRTLEKINEAPNKRHPRKWLRQVRRTERKWSRADRR